MPRPEICPKAKPVDAPCVFRSRRIRVVAWQGLCDLASALGEQQRHPADRPMSLDGGRSHQSQAPGGQILNLGMLLLAKSIVTDQPLCNGLVHLL